MKNLAQAMKDAGIGVGDVVEVAKHVDSIDRAIHNATTKGEEWKGEDLPIMNGWLLEITALGESVIVGMVVTGFSKDGHRQTYGDCVWSRAKGAEMTQRSATYFRKVGHTQSGFYLFDQPDLVNVYARCQR